MVGRGGEMRVVGIGERRHDGDCIYDCNIVDIERIRCTRSRSRIYLRIIQTSNHSFVSREEIILYGIEDN